MSLIEHAKSWGRNLWAGLEAAEEGPYGHIDRQLASLRERVHQLESEKLDNVPRARDRVRS